MVTSSTAPGTKDSIKLALDGVGLGAIDVTTIATSVGGQAHAEVRVPFTALSSTDVGQLSISPSLASPFKLVGVRDVRLDGETLVFDMLVNSENSSPGPVNLTKLVITYGDTNYAIGSSDSDGPSLKWLFVALVPIVVVLLEEYFRRRQRKTVTPRRGAPKV